MLVWTRDGDLLAFESLSEAAGDMEAIDVDEGEYVAAFTLDGRPVAISAGDGRVILNVGEEPNLAELRRRLTDSQARSGFHSPTNDPVAVASELVWGAWDHRWPQRPGWLARRLHGPAPTLPRPQRRT